MLIGSKGLRLMGTPGLLKLATLGSGPVRALYTASNGRAFAVSGDTLYELDGFWTGTNRGTLSTSSGRVVLADNGLHMMIVDGGGYTFTFSTNALAPITDPDFPGAGSVSFQDGFFVFHEPGTGRLWVTESYNGASVDALDFVTSEGSPDPVVTQISDHSTIYAFNTLTLERYYNSGGADFPFTRYRTGGLLQIGCASAASVVQMNKAIYWLGQDVNGQGTVWAISENAYSQRISTHAVELAIREYATSADLGDVTAWCYQTDGHNFYCMNLAETTFVYDDATTLWHERAYLADNGRFERHRADCHAVTHGVHIVGDYQNGNLYALDEYTYTDNGEQIARERITPRVAQDGAWIFIPRLELRMDAGMGLDGGVAGSDPMVMLQISRDGGRTFGPERWRSAGKIGEFRRRAAWNRNGRARDWVFRVRLTDPVRTVWNGMHIPGIRAGKS
jgi:hypothetical protein